MEIFPCGDAEVAGSAVRSFVDEADEAGDECGFSSDDDDDGKLAPTKLWRDSGVLDLPDTSVPHAVIVVGGQAVVLGDSPSRVGPGQAALWSPTEPFGIEVVNEPLVFFQLEGPTLRRSDLGVRTQG
jgi:hypothetical protein